MNCPRCNTKQPPGAQFCHNCGAPLSENNLPQQSFPLRIEYGNVFCTMQNYSGSIEIPSSIDGQLVTAIGQYGFRECHGLTRIVIPKTINTIGEGAFYYCYSLVEITMPESVVDIGGQAFTYCSSLKRITIPNSVKNIGASAFFGCSSLVEIICPRNSLREELQRNWHKYGLRGKTFLLL